jgi:carbon storage regulator CsrA
VRITGNSVRIGVEAPADMPVVRQELKEAIEKSISPLGDSSQSSSRRQP